MNGDFKKLYEDVKARAAIVGVVRKHVQLRPAGRGEWVGLCPFHHEKSPSFTVVERKGFYHCFGCAAHGNAVNFIVNILGIDFRDAVNELARDLGLVPVEAGRPKPRLAPVIAPVDHAQIDRETAAKRRWAVDLWRGCRSARGSVVEAYLRSRAIVIDAPPSLRYHPGLKHPYSGKIYPCMVAGIQGPDGAIIGVHRTFLLPDGARVPGKAKMMAGEAWGGAVRFAKPAPVMAFGEGIETVLSVHQVALADGGMDFGRGFVPLDQLGFWAALSLGNLAGAGLGYGPPHPTKKNKRGRPVSRPSRRPDPARSGLMPPPETRVVVLLADGDNKDAVAAEDELQRAVRRYLNAGCETLIMRPPSGYDFNDVAQGKAA